MIDKNKPEPRKYVIKNIHTGPVHVKELRKSLSPGKEIEWEGILSEGASRLEAQKMLSIKDIGPSSKVNLKDPLVRSAKMVEREKAITAQAREKLDKNPSPKDKGKGTVEAASASEVFDSLPETNPPSSKEEVMTSAGASSSGLDSMTSPAPKDKKKSKKE